MAAGESWVKGNGRKTDGPAAIVTIVSVLSSELSGGKFRKTS